MKHVHNLLWFWLPPIVYMGAIFYLSSLSSPEIGGDTPDYILHGLEYFLLTLLLIRLTLSRQAAENDFSHWQRACLVGVAIAVAYGVSDEIHQYFTPGRHCSLHDVFADGFGAFMAYGAAVLDYHWLTRHHAWIHSLKRLKPINTVSYAFYRFK